MEIDHLKGKRKRGYYRDDFDENQRVEYFATHYKNYHPAYYDQLYREGIERANKIEGIESADVAIKRILTKGFAKGYIDSNI